MKRLFSICLALSFLFSTVASADEGMWLYNEAPKDKIKAKYGFELTQQWLDHVRLSSVRFNNGGSGSFVSADGLTFTNHHVGAGCVQQLSSEGHDYIKTGFYAKTQAEEAKCPNLELNELVGIEDVTDKVNAGVKPEMSAADVGQAQRAAMSQIEKDCSTSTGLRCDVVTIFINHERVNGKLTGTLDVMCHVRLRPGCAAMWSLSTPARFITYINTRSTPMCAWSLRQSLTLRSSVAIPTTLPIPVTILTSLSSASTKMGIPRTLTTICAGRARA